MNPSRSTFIRSLLSPAMWNLPNGNVSLTFDDGPHPKTTPVILKTLDAYGIKGTFFFLGENVKKHPELAQEAAIRGHGIGNHGIDHSLLLFRDWSYVLSQITETANRIREVTGRSSTLFRPPYGYIRPSHVQSLESTSHKLVMWDLDPRDWSQRSASQVAATIKREIHPGSIILLHDNSNTMGKIHTALTIVLDSLLSEYEFSAIPT